VSGISASWVVDLSGTLAYAGTSSGQSKLTLLCCTGSGRRVGRRINAFVILNTTRSRRLPRPASKAAAMVKPGERASGVGRIAGPAERFSTVGLRVTIWRDEICLDDASLVCFFHAPPLPNKHRGSCSYSKECSHNRTIRVPLVLLQRNLLESWRSIGLLVFWPWRRMAKASSMRTLTS
jgi:hypothetical protein